MPYQSRARGLCERSADVGRGKESLCGSTRLELLSPARFSHTSWRGKYVKCKIPMVVVRACLKERLQSTCLFSTANLTRTKVPETPYTPNPPSCTMSGEAHVSRINPTVVCSYRPAHCPMPARVQDELNISKPTSSTHVSLLEKLEQRQQCTSNPLHLECYLSLARKVSKDLASGTPAFVRSSSNHQRAFKHSNVSDNKGCP